MNSFNEEYNNLVITKWKPMMVAVNAPTTDSSLILKASITFENIEKYHSKDVVSQFGEALINKSPSEFYEIVDQYSIKYPHPLAWMVRE